jgi:transcription antitermination protein NusB
MGSRRKAREQALQILYLIDMAATPAEEALSLFRANFESQEEEFEFAASLVRGVVQHGGGIDELIEHHSEHWKIHRMPRIDRNILRLGVFELMHCPDTPGPVALDEAVELAKRYGDTKTPAFVNGILDRVFRETRNKV